MRLETRPAAEGPAAAVASRVIEDALGGVQREDRQFLAWLEGMLTAAAVGPARVRPTEWMHAIRGKDYVYRDAAQAQSLLSGLVLMHNCIAGEIERNGVDYEPRVLSDAPDGEKVSLAMEWAKGFFAGVFLRRESWDALLTAQRTRLPLVIIASFLNGLLDGGNPEPADQVEERTQTREELLPMLGTAVFMLSEHWKGQSRHTKPARAAALPKVGRNEPCPCGSGRKYKKCCLDRAEPGVDAERRMQHAEPLIAAGRPAEISAA